ncbi:aryl-sulfate sulfotransferase N-terminal domain-containing protein [Salmonella enterica subsp. enterica serovar Kentucky]|nr:aryl-sulfate sulfotransferase N-terminal domain-containing protein [Salmonella enterica subsp. enterica serovar Kentucky]
MYPDYVNKVKVDWTEEGKKQTYMFRNMRMRVSF